MASPSLTPSAEANARQRGVLAAAALVLVAATAVMGAIETPHRHIRAFLIAYAIAFSAYAAAAAVVLRMRTAPRTVLWAMLAVAIVARAVVIPARPDLSTDFYRYLWEGRAVLHGANPFTVAPADTTLAFLRDSDYDLINHKTLVTIYPPLAQGVFALAAWIHPGVITLKIILSLFDLATIALLVVLLRSLGRPPTHALLYAWSPLVIVETGLSGHMDAAGVCLLVLGLLLWQRGHWVRAGLVFGASVLVKYLALVLVPSLARHRAVRALVAMGIVVALGYAAFIDAGARLLGSLGVYGGAWWFNGPPFMALSGLLGDGTLARRLLIAGGVAFALIVAHRERDLLRYSYLTVGCALLLSPTVYPWYLVWIIPWLCVYPNRAWLAFSGLVALSYWVWIEYDRSGVWRLPNWLLALEYVPFYLLLAYDAVHGRVPQRSAGCA